MHKDMESRSWNLSIRRIFLKCSMARVDFPV